MEAVEAWVGVVVAFGVSAMSEWVKSGSELMTFRFQGAAWTALQTAARTVLQTAAWTVLQTAAQTALKTVA